MYGISIRSLGGIPYPKSARTQQRHGDEQQRPTTTTSVTSGSSTLSQKLGSGLAGMARLESALKIFLENEAIYSYSYSSKTI